MPDSYYAKRKPLKPLKDLLCWMNSFLKGYHKEEKTKPSTLLDRSGLSIFSSSTTVRAVRGFLGSAITWLIPLALRAAHCGNSVEHQAAETGLLFEYVTGKYDLV